MMRLAIGCVGAAALAACSSDTGILVEVHGDRVDADVARVETLVVVDDGTATPPEAAAWGITPTVSAAVAVDLHTDPYTVLLHPDPGGTDAAVWIAALGYDAGDTLVAWGRVDAPVAFQPDLIKKISLDLYPASATAGACAVQGQTILVRPTADCDGDQVPVSTDCDDLDPQIVADVDGDPVVCAPDCDQTNPHVFPGAKEVCDGVDNDCDLQTLPPPQLCVSVTRSGDTVIDCRVGQQACNDAQGTYGTCEAAPINITANDSLCQYWADCLAAGGDVQACLVDGRMTCKLAVGAGPEPCLAAITPTSLAEYAGLTGDCTWRIVGNPTLGAWSYGLRQLGSSDPLDTFYGNCDAELVIAEAGLVPHYIVLEADTGLELLDYAVLIDPRPSDCDPTSSDGSTLECQVAP